MSQSSVFKSVGGVTTKITTTKKTVTTQQQQLLQQKQHYQTQQKVITKPPQKKETEKENHITVKSTFNASDKKQQNQQHQQQDVPAPKTKPQQSHAEDACVRCNRTVYKMEEVIAEHQIWHKNCFRCKECDKPLNRHSKVDSFQIHDGVVYCKFHFKQLFGPKAVDDASKRKRELTIHENQPAALPDGVVLSSEQNSLGLENIQTDAVKTRFQMFEKISTTKEAREELQRNVGVKRSATVLSKMKKFHAKGLDVGIIGDDDYDDDDSIHSEDYDDETDVDLIRAKRAQRERPMNFDNMADIKNKFESGVEQGREERHQERKQEIQNIRSKLFFGKQARTKEMYQNALAELDTATKQRNKGFSTAHEMENVKAAAKNAQNIKLSFETGDVYRKSNSEDEEFDVDPVQVKQRKGILSKGSATPQISNKVFERMQLLAKQQAQDGTVKSHAKVKDVQKADIMNQFEFFENYNPEDHKGKGLIITPPREAGQNGIKIDGFKIDLLNINGVVEGAKSNYIERLNQSETYKKQAIQNIVDAKQTPTPSKMNGKKVDEPETENLISSKRPGYLDADLEHARQAARARDLKDRFEQWNYDNNNDSTAYYDDTTPEYDEIDDSQTETTKTIRAKFENLPNSGRLQNTRQPKVNRFV